MDLPKGAELLGTNAAELAIRGALARTVVQLNAEGQRTLAALPATFGPELPVRIYLLLTQVRGTHDATVLNAYLPLPGEDPLPGPPPRRVGSMALYGLRRASLPQGPNAGPGLTFMFDITQLLLELRATRPLTQAEIPVSLVPEPPLPAADLVVGRVGLFRITLP